MQEQIQQMAAAVGLRPEQVQAGLGSVVRFIQARVPAPVWEQLSARMPQVQGWVSQAATLAAPAAQAAAARLGAAGGDVATLLADLRKSGISPDQAVRFVPMVLEQLRAKAGPEVVQKVLASVPGLAGIGGGLSAAAQGLADAASGLLGGLFRK